MGEAEIDALKVDFDRELRLEFHGAKVTSDAGLLAYRELDDAFGLTAAGTELLADARTGANTQHTMTALLRQAVLGRLAGYEDTNDADRLRVDPAMRHVVGGRARDKLGASTSEMGRFETEFLTRPENTAALTEMPGLWVDRVRERVRPTELILDMDSSQSETYGEQEGSAWNGHFRCTCYHPLFLFNQDGDLERAMLREGNVHSAKEWRTVLEPVVERYRGRRIARFFRADAAFARPEIYQYLESKRFLYAIRLPANQILQEKIKHLLKRPVGSPARSGGSECRGPGTPGSGYPRTGFRRSEVTHTAAVRAHRRRTAS